MAGLAVFAAFEREIWVSELGLAGPCARERNGWVGGSMTVHALRKSGSCIAPVLKSRRSLVEC